MLTGNICYKSAAGNYFSPGYSLMQRKRINLQILMARLTIQVRKIHSGSWNESFFTSLTKFL
jgi:hypothetical protein